MTWIRWLLAHLEVLTRLVVLLGIPTGLYQYWRKIRYERRDRDYGTYNALDEKYIDFQRLCLDHPELDVFDIPDATTPAELSKEHKKQELIAFTLLFSIFERAFLMYRDRSRRVRAKQWTGWEAYLLSYCKRPNFRGAWDISGHTFDDDFQNCMRDYWLKDESAPSPARRRWTSFVRKLRRVRASSAALSQ